MNQQSSEQPLSGQQIQSLQKGLQEKMVGIVKDVDLRKWSIDQACGLAGTAIEHKAAKPIDVVETARQIHAFLTELASDTKGPNQV